ncbi:hypothetical protein AAG570_014161 [Ranatra chinensis]|uniref:NADH-ubiquinone oxidoreductase 75 kDa subunit, mitochondrial n=1 Tax=Ranatra chinensis TaxID=642074 RepID=A0ABD0YDZ2_9HEMI
MAIITINGRDLHFTLGQTILEVAREAEITIPTLCWLPKTGHNNVCRICVVAVAGADRLLPSCSTPAADGMVVETNSPEVRQARKSILSLIIADGRHDCFMRRLPEDRWPPYQVAAATRLHREHACSADGACQLQALAIEYKVPVKDLEPEPGDFPLDNFYPMITRDFSRCIQCGRCASVCSAIQVNDAIVPQFGRRAEKEHWWPAVDYSRCTHCGECLQVCPTGALTAKKAYGLSVKEDLLEKIRTTCPYCGVGCQQELVVKDGRIIRINGVEGAEPNRGSLCVKGRFGYDFIYSKERLTDPLIRREDGTFRTATWDEALDLIAEKFKKIIATSGPDALAGLSCSRSINEDSYQMQKLFRAVFKTNNIDNCART